MLASPIKYRTVTSGITFNIQQFSTEDGPGIRTTVFMKGCPLRCVWCHNPEGMRPTQDLMWYDVRCIAARDCLRVCPEDALDLTKDGMLIDRQRCTLCGECTEVCPSAALEVIGQQWTPESLMAELIKDRIFYETSGGGITFSGGEPMLQTDFLVAVLPGCKEEGLHVALDTCGTVSWECYERVLPWVDMVLLDLKIMDPQRHQQAAGVSNDIILENAKRLAEAGMTMWVRTPIVPGYTQDDENIRAIGSFIQENLTTIERWDLLAYTNLGRPKYHRLDIPYVMEETLLLTREEMESAWQVAHELVPVAKWSGATRSLKETRENS